MRQIFKFIIAKNKLVISLVLVLSVVFGYLSTKLSIDASAETLLLEHDPDLKAYRQIAKRYDSPGLLVVAFTPKDDVEPLFKEQNELNLKEDEALISLANPINLPSFFANYASQTAKRAKLYASGEFMAKFEISQNEAVILEKNGQKLAICVELDSELGGVAAYLGDYDDKLDVSAIFEGKSYASVKIIKAENE